MKNMIQNVRSCDTKLLSVINITSTVTYYRHTLLTAFHWLQESC